MPGGPAKARSLGSARDEAFGAVRAGLYGPHGEDGPCDVHCLPRMREESAARTPRFRGVARRLRAAPRRVRRLVLGGLRSRPASKLRGNLDEPTALTLLRGPRRVSGWALDDSRPPAKVEVTFNGEVSVEAALGEPRPDVPLNLGEPAASAACGWSVWVDLATWPPGDLQVKVVAVDRSGRASELAYRAFLLTGTGLEGQIDTPAPGEELEGELLVVRGWASIDGGGASRIEVTLDGKPAGRARLRLPRPDVAAVPVRRFGPMLGFEYRGLLPEGATEAVEVSLEVVGFRGSRERLPELAVRHTPRRVSDQEEERAAALRQRTARVLGERGASPSNRTPRLLVFTHSLAIGGGQLYLSEMLRCLVRELPDCTVVSPRDGVLRPDLEALGIDVVVRASPIGRYLETYEGEIRDLSFFIRGSGADVVLLNTLGCFPAGDAAERLGVPVIWSIHESFAIDDWLDLNLRESEWHPYLRDRLICTLQHADRLVFEATATSQLFAPYADSERRAVVRYGVDVNAIDTYRARLDRTVARASHGIAPDAMVLLAVGVLEERKSPACIVEAFTRVASVHPDAVLIVVGDHPCPYSVALHQVVEDAGLQDRLQLLPITSDIWHWYALADVLISASDVESLPRSMLEAMVFAVPPLCADVFGVAEVVQDDRTGWLFPERDMVALVAALHRVLSLNADELRAVGEACREVALRDHRSEGYGEEYRRMIEAMSERLREDQKPS